MATVEEASFQVTSHTGNLAAVGVASFRVVTVDASVRVGGSSTMAAIRGVLTGGPTVPGPWTRQEVPERAVVLLSLVACVLLLAGVCTLRYFTAVVSQAGKRDAGHKLTSHNIKHTRAFVSWKTDTGRQNIRAASNNNTTSRYNKIQCPRHLNKKQHDLKL